MCLVNMSRSEPERQMRGRGVTRESRGRGIQPPPARGALSLTVGVGGGGVGLRRDMTPISIFMEFIRHVRCGGERQRYVKVE